MPISFIPPEGLRFRLFGYASQCRIFSRTHQEPQVGHLPVCNGEFPDQWFTLIHGTGERSGLYAIKSEHTGKVLFSRRHVEPYVGHADGGGKFDDK
jgi:hypothetical protein